MMSLGTQVAVLQSEPGRYEFTNEHHRWSYQYGLSALGTKSERRSGVLQLDDKEVAGKVGEGVETPWGPMERFEAEYEAGWLLERTHGQSIAPAHRVEIPADALEPSGEWHAVIMPWQYRLFTVAMGTRSETRSGKLFYNRGVVTAEVEGSRIETPWGVMWWLGKPHDGGEIVPGDYEAGWLLRGTYDRPFDMQGPFIYAGEIAGPEGLTMLASMYLAESSLGHGVTFSVPRRPATRWHGSLNVDPNVCQLNEFGDRTICTKMAVRHHDVEVSQRRLPDPLHLGRRIYAVTGPDLPAPMTLVADARFTRFHLKTDRELIPLFPVPPRR